MLVYQSVLLLRFQNWRDQTRKSPHRRNSHSWDKACPGDPGAEIPANFGVFFYIIKSSFYSIEVLSKDNTHVQHMGPVSLSLYIYIYTHTVYIYKYTVYTVYIYIYIYIYTYIHVYLYLTLFTCRWATHLLKMSLAVPTWWRKQ